jgi:3D (Asp-Asp-Asp) domain-containing protein
LQTPEKVNKIQVETKKDFNDTVRASIREVTAYNVGDPEQNDGDPCISANGENICAALNLGLKRCAANFVPFGTQLSIDHYGVCTVTDRMNRRYKDRVDIAMKVTEKNKALQFGVKKLKVTILRTSDRKSKLPAVYGVR